MAELTKEELAELALLEKEEADRIEAEALMAKRQHLDALRLAKRLAPKHGTPGRDFLIMETILGNIAIRRPVDVEIDTIEADSDRGALEALAAAIVIEPKAEVIQGFMASHHGLMGAIVSSSAKLLKVMREEDAKK